MAESLQQLLVTNFGLSPSGYTGSQGAVGATGLQGPANGYTGSTGYVGSAGTGVTLTVDTFTGDGTTTAFTLSTTPGNINQTIVNYNGVTILRSAYLLSDDTITFSSAPAAGSEIEVTTINPSGAATGATGTALKISTIGYIGNNTATDIAGGETLTLTGTGFASGASVIINGTASGVVTVVSSTQLTFAAPAMTAGTYILYVVNPDGATAISVPGVSYSGTPSFYTGAGSVGSVYEATAFNSNVAAAGDSAITYSIASGSLPTGATLNANGVITGTSVLTASPTTYTFGVMASDGQNQDVVRSYTITVNPDTVSWSSPTDGATISLAQGSSSTTTLTATSAAGKTITYTANALPTGLSIVGAAVTGTPTVSGNTTTLLTANAASTTRTATVTVTWNVTVAIDAYFPYTTLMLPGNGTNNANNNTFLDSSTNNFTITRAGNTTQGTFSPYGSNWSNSFASSTVLQFPYASTLTNWWTQDFTIEMWVFNNTNAGSASNNLPLQFAHGDYTSAATYWSFGTTSTGTVQFYYYNGTTNAVTSTATVALSTWNHIAMVYTNSTGNISLYLNGVSVASATKSGTPQSSSGNTINIGAVQGTYYSGHISNLRILNGTALYTTSFTPSATPLTAVANTQLLTCQSNRFRDNSTNNATPTTIGSPKVLRFSPFSPGSAYSTSVIGGSGYFDGTGDYLTAPSDAAFGFGTGDFTVECWVNPSSQGGHGSSNNDCIIDFRLNTGSGAYGTLYIFNNGTGVYWYANGANQITGGTIKNNAWTHLVVSRVSGSTRLFINGVQSGSTYADSTNYATSIASISQFSEGIGGGYFNGYMSDVRIIKGSGVTSVTVPTAPLTAITNTSLLLSYTNAGVVDGAMQNNIETAGDAKISTAVSKFGGSSMSFDGSGDYLTIASNPNLNFGTGDFTVECWAYFNSLANSPMIWHKNNAGSGWFFEAATNILYFGYAATSPSQYYQLTGITLTTSTWYHLAVTRVGTTLSIFLNGTKYSSTVSGAGASADNSAAFIIGSYYPNNVSYDLNGYIDDLRITTGYARYTANFTPPTTALGTQ